MRSSGYVQRGDSEWKENQPSLASSLLNRNKFSGGVFSGAVQTKTQTHVIFNPKPVAHSDYAG